MKKKITSLILAFSMLVSILAVLPTMAGAEGEATQDSSVLTEEQKAASTITIVEGVADGSAELPVEIWNKAQLLDFAARVNGTGAYAESKNIYLSAILKADVDLNEGYTYEVDASTLLVKVTDPNGISAYVGTAVKKGVTGNWYSDTNLTEGVPEGFVKPAEWTPIGQSGRANAYKGSFNGNGHTVSGMFIAKNASNLGFFGYAGSDENAGVVITSLTVKDSCVIGAGNIGGVVGYIATNAGDPNNSTSNYCDHTDGVCDYNYSLHESVKANQASNSNNGFGIKDIKVTYCNNDNTVVSSTGTYSGGVVGCVMRGFHYFKNTNGVYCQANRNPNESGNAFLYLENTGTVISKGGNAAGIVGYGDIGCYKHCYNYGDVYSTNANIAGICSGGDNISGSYLFNYGNITGTNKVSGIANFRNRDLSNCLNAGNVTATNGMAAGIARSEGDGKNYTNCANVGTITATTIASGIYIGSAAKAYTLTKCYNAGEIVAPKAAQLIYTNTATSVNLTGSMYLEESEVEAYYLDGLTITPSVLPTAFKEAMVANGELAEALGKDLYHQTLADGYPVPGEGNVAVPIEGTGTASDPFLIYNARQLKEFATRVNADSYVNANGETVSGMETACAKLMADIDLNPGYDFEYVEANKLVKVTDPNGISAYIGTGHGGTARGSVYADTALTANAPSGFVSPSTWTPIGNTEASAYRGTFNGNGKTVSGLYIRSASVTARGLFGYVSGDWYNGVNISDITVSDFCVIGQDKTGAIVGYAPMLKGGNVACSAEGHIERVTESGTTIDCACGMRYTGTAGDSSGYKPMTIKNCTTEDGVVAGTSYVGGVIGYTLEVTKTFSITKIALDGTQTTRSYTARTRNGHSFINNVNRADAVFGAGDHAGGVVGRGDVGTWTSATNYADVFNTSSYTGGVLGSCNNVSLGSHFNYGNVTGKTRVGGIIGSTTRGMSNSYNAGNITGTDNVGGIAGVLGGGGVGLSNCGNSGNITGSNYVGGIAGTGEQSQYEASIKNSYNAGLVNGSTYVGGLLGYGDSGTTTSGKQRKYTISGNYVLENCVTATAEGAVVNISATVSENMMTGSSVVAATVMTQDQIKNGELLTMLGTSFGQSVNMDYPVPGFTTELAGVDVTLKDGLLLNFYIDASMNLGVNSHELVSVGDYQYYKVVVEVAAKEIGKDFSAQLKKGSNAVGAKYTFSVLEYANGILAGDYSDEAKALVRAMLNYGAAAQEYFNYDTDNLVGAPETDTSALAGATVDEVEVTGESYYGATLILEGKLKLRLYFIATGLEGTVNGEAAEVVDNGKYTYFDIELTPDNIDSVYTVVLGENTVKYSAMNYLKNNVANEALSEMVASIYAYGVAADAYVVSLGSGN